MAGSAGKRQRVEDNNECDSNESIISLLNELKLSVANINTKLEDLPRLSSEIKLLNETVSSIKFNMDDNTINIKSHSIDIEFIWQHCSAIQTRYTSLSKKF